VIQVGVRLVYNTDTVTGSDIEEAGSYIDETSYSGAYVQEGSGSGSGSCSGSGSSSTSTASSSSSEIEMYNPDSNEAGAQESYTAYACSGYLETDMEKDVPWQPKPPGSGSGHLIYNY
jgi:hypothetical protein